MQAKSSVNSPLRVLILTWYDNFGRKNLPLAATENPVWRLVVGGDVAANSSDHGHSLF